MIIPMKGKQGRSPIVLSSVCYFKHLGWFPKRNSLTWQGQHEKIPRKHDRGLSAPTAFLFTNLCLRRLCWENISVLMIEKLRPLSRYSDGVRAEPLGCNSRQGIFLYSTASDRLWGPPSLLHNGYWRALTAGVKRQGAWSWPLTSI
jgi:hypothetical protein